MIQRNSTIIEFNLLYEFTEEFFIKRIQNDQEPNTKFLLHLGINPKKCESLLMTDWDLNFVMFLGLKLNILKHKSEHYYYYYFSEYH